MDSPAEPEVIKIQTPDGLIEIRHDEPCHGWLTVPQDGAERAMRCPVCRRHKIAAALDAFIPPRFRKPIELPPRIAEWVTKGREAEGLYITGPVGTGKTQAAYAALAAWCTTTGTMPSQARVTENYGVTNRTKPTVVFTRATTFFDELRPGNDRNRQLVNDCQMADLLIIDDIGAEKPSEWTAEKLYEVVDERYAQANPFIVTSNVPPKALADQVGHRVASRFAEICEVVPMTGPDRRLTAS